MLTYDDLIKKVRSYASNVNEDLIKKAYLFALKQHGTQTRESGELYFSHPLTVARILADLKMDQVTIVAGLLHDTLEDTSATLPELKKMFGSEISTIVNGVTKLSQIENIKVSTQQTENYKKLLLAAASDIRVLIIKLVDRLHNMRTLKFKKRKCRREAIARETIEIYAPLAERVGLYKIKDELQDTAFYELYPALYNAIRNKLKDLYNSEDEIINTIRDKLVETLGELKIPYKISGRLKTPYSIWNKMNVRTMSFGQLSDIMAFRIIVENEKQCYQVLGLIHRKYLVVPKRFRDYISAPKLNGYQSLHTCVIGPLNKRIEIQIRTQKMHLMAEYGIAAHWEYKENKNTKYNVHSSYQWLKDMVRVLDNSSKMEDFVKYSKTEIVSEHVFGVTPKGEIIPLPIGSSVLDFAYAIHTEIGNHAIGATVNNQKVPLKTIIENGDQINILTDKDATPHGVWQTYVTTVKAKTAIRQALMNFENTHVLITGKTCFDDMLKNNNITLSDADFKLLLNGLNFDNENQFYFSVGSSSLSMWDISRKFEEIFGINLIFNSDFNYRTKLSDMIVGLPNIPIDRKFCCSPVLGDKLFGVISSSVGGQKSLEIHIEECVRFKNLLFTANSQVISLSWNGMYDYSNVTFPIKLFISVLNSPGILGRLSSIIEQKNCSILSLRIEDLYDGFRNLIIELSFYDLTQLNTLIALLLQEPHVRQVSRT